MTDRTPTTWRASADRDLLVNMPGPVRVALEVVLLLALVLGGHVEEGPIAVAAVLVAVEAALALALLRPWASDDRSVGLRLLSVGIALLAVAAPLLAHGPSGTTRRLGVELLPVDKHAPLAAQHVPREPVYAEVKRVTPGTPAAELLQTGDRIEAVNGVPLVGDDPPDELARRVQDDALPEDFPVAVRRGANLESVVVHVPRVSALANRMGLASRLANDHVIVATALRDLLFIAFLIALARVDGQPMAALGLVREGAGRELAFAVPALGGVFLIQVAAALPIALIGSVAGFGKHEAVDRMDTLSRMSGQTSVAPFMVSLLVAAAFEEVAFRAFLTPRIRTLTGSWPVGIVLVSVVFGLGHLYEGTVAVVQTAILGLYFTAVYLARRRLVAVAVCHAGFNAIMFVLVQLIVRSGVVERLKELTPP